MCSVTWKTGSGAKSYLPSPRKVSGCGMGGVMGVACKTKTWYELPEVISYNQMTFVFCMPRL